MAKKVGQGIFTRSEPWERYYTENVSDYFASFRECLKWAESKIMEG